MGRRDRLPDRSPGPSRDGLTVQPDHLARSARPARRWLTRASSRCADDLLELKDEIVAIAGRDTPARLRAARPGFRACTARGTDGRLAGFAYGWEGGPGDWWWDIVAGAVSADVRRRWFDDCFELVGLAVLAADRRRGIGGALHDTVLG